MGIALLVWALISGSLAAALATVRPSFVFGLLGRPKQLVVGGLAAIIMRVTAGFRFESEATSGLFNITWPLVGYVHEPSAVGLSVAGAAMVTLFVGVVKQRPAWIGAGLLVMMFAEPVSSAGGLNAVGAAGVLPVIWALDPIPKTADTQRKGPAEAGPFRTRWFLGLSRRGQRPLR